jgi:hypothetical protein
MCDCQTSQPARVVALIDDRRPIGGGVEIPWCQSILPGGGIGGTLAAPNPRGGLRFLGFGCPDCNTSIRWADPTPPAIADALRGILGSGVYTSEWVPVPTPVDAVAAMFGEPVEASSTDELRHVVYLRGEHPFTLAYINTKFQNWE